MTTLSTHVLDTMHGRPAAGMTVVLSGPEGEIGRGRTDPDGRPMPVVPSSGQGGAGEIAAIDNS